MTDENQYREAVKNPAVRQDFLNGINMEDASRYIRVVGYADTNIRRADGATVLMRCISNQGSIFRFKGIRSSIIVFPAAFSEINHPIYEDFLSSLIDHEGFHARENFENPTIVSPSLRKVLGKIITTRDLNTAIKYTEEYDKQCEIRATLNQIEQIKRKARRSSMEFALSLMIRLTDYSPETDVHFEFTDIDGVFKIS